MARLSTGSTGSTGMKVVPPLYDVVVVGCTGEWWTIAGHERVISAPIGEEYVLGQSWLIQPAQCEDLAKAEGEWRRLAEELHVLREKSSLGEQCVDAATRQRCKGDAHEP